MYKHFFQFIVLNFWYAFHSSKYDKKIPYLGTLYYKAMINPQNETHHSNVPFFNDMMISPLISLLKGQHFQKAFIVEIKPKHLFQHTKFVC